MDARQKKSDGRARRARRKSELKDIETDVKQLKSSESAEEILAKKYDRDAAGRFVVSVNTDKAISIYNDKVLDAGFIAHIESEYDFIPMDTETSLMLNGDNSAEVSEMLFQHLLQASAMMARRLRNSSILTAALFVIGIAFLLMYSFFHDNFIIGDIMMIVAWVFVWSAVDLMFFGRNGQKIELYRRRRILTALKHFFKTSAE